MAAPLIYRAYVGATVALAPLAARAEARKLNRAGIPRRRAREKRGYATQERPDAAPLIWFHAASVGESLSVLALIAQMGEALPKAGFLITSGTATSAQLLAARMPSRCVHQFAPLDAPGPVERFLDHWRPDAAIFVESELWPQMLRRTHARGVPMALLNARLSPKSVKNWTRQPALARHVLGVFDLILTQNAPMAEAMIAMHAPPERVAAGSNLKALSAPLPVDDAALTEAREALGDRPVWVAASTHEGEEEIVLAAHKALLARRPGLHLVLVPRHPVRGDAVARLIADAGLSATRRSAGDAPGGDVYLADTLGELGTWYAQGHIVFIGGSLRPIGGHNPFEVAQAGAAALSGPHVANFAETFAEMRQAGAVQHASDARELEKAVATLLDAPDTLRAMQDAAAGFVKTRTDALAGVSDRLINALQLG